MIATVDTQTLKSSIDLRDIAGAHTELQKLTKAESAGACPKCHGTDRFHAQSEWFFCRQCHEKRGDAIELVQFLGLASGFQDAVSWLERWQGGHYHDSHESKRESASKPRRAGKWQEPDWQREARALVDTAAERLSKDCHDSSDSGAAGRAYLASRGFEPATWSAWRLGLADVWHPKREQKLPAVIMPYMSASKIKAVQYRFIGSDIDKSERFSMKAGGERTLFGAHMIAGREILAILEGELNAVSLWQAAGDLVDVVSIGSEDNTTSAAPYAAKIAERYPVVLVWTDKPAVAHELSDVIGRRAVLMQSSAIDGAKLDANEVLRRGFLRDLALTKILEAHLAELGHAAGTWPEFAKPEHEKHATFERFCALEALWQAEK